VDFVSWDTGEELVACCDARDGGRRIERRVGRLFPWLGDRARK
jgi:hypothetical protein